MELKEQLDNHIDHLDWLEKNHYEITDEDRNMYYCTKDIDFKILQQLYESKSRSLQRFQLIAGIHPNKEIQRLYTIKSKKIEEIKSKLETDICYFITINPKVDNVDILHNLIKDLKFWKCLNHYYYVFEQRSEDLGTYRGIHCHIAIVNHSFQHSVLLRRFTEKFKSICGAPYKNTINIKRKSKSHIQETIDDYMSGLKEPEKIKKVENDILFRKTYELEDIYEVNTTDKDSPLKKDGRVTNGGKRKGSGAKKKLWKDSEIQDMSITNKITEFEF